MKNIYIYILIGIVILAVLCYIYCKKYDHFCTNQQLSECIVNCMGNNQSPANKAYCGTKCSFECDF